MHVTSAAPVRFTRSHGFSLVEVLVAMTILIVAVTALAQLSSVSARANANAKATTFASMLAAQKMEQLRALTWGFDAVGAPLSDLTTDITVFPPQAGSGAGLSLSPAGALGDNSAGYCDFLDASGTSLGGGTTPPAGAVFVRRWSIEPMQSNHAHTLALQVLVTRVRHHPGGVADILPDDTWMVTVRTRKAA